MVITAETLVEGLKNMGRKLREANEEFSLAFSKATERIETEQNQAVQKKFKFYQPKLSKDFFGDEKCKWELRESPLSDEQMLDWSDFNWKSLYKFL